jgi:hypothetical protein
VFPGTSPGWGPWHGREHEGAVTRREYTVPWPDRPAARAVCQLTAGVNCGYDTVSKSSPGVVHDWPTAEVREASVRTACVLGVLAMMIGVLPLGAAGLEIVVYKPASPQAGQEVTFRFSPEVLREGDSVAFTFGDGGSATVPYTLGCGLFGGCAEVKHTYAGAGTFSVSGTGTISGNPVSGSVQVTVTAGPEPPDVFVATGAHQIGYNNTVWRTDLEVHNPGGSTVTYRIALLKRDIDNSVPQVAEFTLKSGRSAHHPDVLFDPFGFEGAAALRITPVDGSLVIHSRTYNQLALGSYGQFVPGMNRAQAVVSGQQARLIGLFHDPSLTVGFRTNFGMVNASSAPISVEVSFRRNTGGSLGTRVYDLKALEFRQINKVFEEVTSEPITAGYLLVRVTTTGGRLYAYASMVDNVTGDAIFIPAVVTP